MKFCFRLQRDAAIFLRPNLDRFIYATLCCLVLTAGLLTSAFCLAQTPPQYMLEVYSNGLSPTDSTLGHAFMVIKIKTDHGYKEDAYGFYPAKNGLQMIIGTPGTLNPEFDKHPERFAKVEEFLQLPITEQDRRNISKVVNSWNTHQYQVTESNCIDFIDNVARAINLPVPDRKSFQTPTQYVAKLRANYEDRVAREAQEHKPAVPEQSIAKFVFVVPAIAPEGFSTGIQVSAGDELAFKASGSWCWSPGKCSGPEGFPGRPLPSELPVLLGGHNFGTLLGRIGSWIFPIGAGVTVQSQSAGALTLVFNDRPSYFNDNSGTMNVSVEHKRR